MDNPFCTDVLRISGISRYQSIKLHPVINKCEFRLVNSRMFHSCTSPSKVCHLAIKLDNPKEL